MNLFKLFSCARPFGASRPETLNEVIARSSRKTNSPTPAPVADQAYDAHSNVSVGLKHPTPLRTLKSQKWESSEYTSTSSSVGGRAYSRHSSSERTEILPSPSPHNDASTSSSLPLVSPGASKEIITASGSLRVKSHSSDPDSSYSTPTGRIKTRLIRELEEAFKLFDANGDGKISAYELRDVLRSLGDHATEEEATLMLKEVDAKGDGYIDLEQFIRIHTVRLDSTGEVASSDELKAAFQVFDLDKDGYITPEELRQVMKSLSDQECTLDDCWKMIKAFDLDGDGRVNFQEFTCLMA